MFQIRQHLHMSMITSHISKNENAQAYVYTKESTSSACCCYIFIRIADN